jgi:hypothetical protein
MTLPRRDNSVLLITIDRPEKYNAADEEMHTGVGAALGGCVQRVLRPASEAADALVTDAAGVGCDIASGRDVEALLVAAVSTSAPSTSCSPPWRFASTLSSYVTGTVDEVTGGRCM